MNANPIPPVPVAGAAPTPLNLPLPGGKQAPRTFRGDHAKVRMFLETYERLLSYHHIVNSADRCTSIIPYVSKNVREVIEALPSYEQRDWATLRADLLRYYDAELYDTRFKKKDLISLTKKTGKLKMNDKTKWTKYARSYIRIAGWLRQRNLISEEEMNAYFWFGIGKRLRRLIEDKLLARIPTPDRTHAYDRNEVCQVAEHLLTRGRFEEAYLASDEEDLGTDWSGESDTDDEFSSDDEEDDLEVVQTLRRRGGKSTKTKIKKHRHLGEYDTGGGNTFETAKELNKKNRLESPRQRYKRKDQDEVEDIVKQLSHMSLTNSIHLDPRYAQMYFTALKLDPDIQKVVPSPETLARRAQPFQTRQANSQGIRQLTPRTITPMRTSYERQPPPHANVQTTSTGNPERPPNRCFGCGSENCTISTCPRVAQEIQEGFVKKDENGRLVHGNGYGIRRINGEPILVAAERERSTGKGGKANSVSFVSQVNWLNQYEQPDQGWEGRTSWNKRRPDSPRNSYAGPVTYETNPEWVSTNFVSVEEIDSDSENDVYMVRGTETDDGSEFEVYIADKAPRKGLEKRRKINEREYEGPRAYKVRRSDDDGTAPRGEQRPMHLPKVPGERSTHPRKSGDDKKQSSSRNIPISTEGKMDSHSKSPYGTRSKGTVPSAQDYVPDIVRTSAREVNEQRIKDLERPIETIEIPGVSFNNGDVVMNEVDRLLERGTDQHTKTSRDRHQQRHMNLEEGSRTNLDLDRIKKPVRQSSIAAGADPRKILQQVMNTQVQLSMADILGVSKDMASLLIEDLKPKSRRDDLPAPVMEMEAIYKKKKKNALITVVASCRGNEIAGIVDTGSEISIVKRETFEEYIPYPFQPQSQIRIRDANSGEGMLIGLVPQVPLKFGQVTTYVDLWVGDKLPFDMLLGLNWLTSNLVSIGQRETGTYLTFNGDKTCKGYELQVGRTSPVDHYAFVAQCASNADDPEEEIPETAEGRIDTDTHGIMEAGSSESVYCCALSANIGTNMEGNYRTNLSLEPGELVLPRTSPDSDTGFLELGRVAYKITCVEGSVPPITFVNLRGLWFKAMIDIGANKNYMATEVWERTAHCPLIPINRHDPRRFELCPPADTQERRVIGETEESLIQVGLATTRAQFTVALRLPYAIILGQPWMEQNRVEVISRNGKVILYVQDPLRINLRVYDLVIEQVLNEPYSSLTPQITMLPRPSIRLTECSPTGSDVEMSGEDSNVSEGARENTTINVNFEDSEVRAPPPYDSTALVRTLAHARTRIRPTQVSREQEGRTNDIFSRPPSRRETSRPLPSITRTMEMANANIQAMRANVELPSWWTRWDEASDSLGNDPNNNQEGTQPADHPTSNDIPMIKWLHDALLSSASRTSIKAKSLAELNFTNPGSEPPLISSPVTNIFNQPLFAASNMPLDSVPSIHDDPFPQPSGIITNHPIQGTLGFDYIRIPQLGRSLFSFEHTPRLPHLDSAEIIDDAMTNLTNRQNLQRTGGELIIGSITAMPVTTASDGRRVFTDFIARDATIIYEPFDRSERLAVGHADIYVRAHPTALPRHAPPWMRTVRIVNGHPQDQAGPDRPPSRDHDFNTQQTPDPFRVRNQVQVFPHIEPFPGSGNTTNGDIELPQWHPLTSSEASASEETQSSSPESPVPGTSNAAIWPPFPAINGPTAPVPWRVNPSKPLDGPSGTAPVYQHLTPREFLQQCSSNSPTDTHTLSLPWTDLRQPRPDTPAPTINPVILFAPSTTATIPPTIPIYHESQSLTNTVVASEKKKGDDAMVLVSEEDELDEDAEGETDDEPNQCSREYKQRGFSKKALLKHDYGDGLEGWERGGKKRRREDRGKPAPKPFPRRVLNAIIANPVKPTLDEILEQRKYTVNSDDESCESGSVDAQASSRSSGTSSTSSSTSIPSWYPRAYIDAVRMRQPHPRDVIYRLPLTKAQHEKTFRQQLDKQHWTLREIKQIIAHSAIVKPWQAALKREKAAIDATSGSSTSYGNNSSPPSTTSNDSPALAPANWRPILDLPVDQQEEAYRKELRSRGWEEEYINYTVESSVFRWPWTDYKNQQKRKDFNAFWLTLQKQKRDAALARIEERRLSKPGMVRRQSSIDNVLRSSHGRDPAFHPLAPIRTKDEWTTKLLHEGVQPAGLTNILGDIRPPSLDVPTSPYAESHPHGYLSFIRISFLHPAEPLELELEDSLHILPDFRYESIRNLAKTYPDRVLTVQIPEPGTSNDVFVRSRPKSRVQVTPPPTPTGSGAHIISNDPVDVLVNVVTEIAHQNGYENEENQVSKRRRILPAVSTLNGPFYEPNLKPSAFLKYLKQDIYPVKPQPVAQSPTPLSPVLSPCTTPIQLPSPAPSSLGSLQYPDSDSTAISDISDDSDLELSPCLSTRDTSPSSTNNSVEEISRTDFEKDQRTTQPARTAISRPPSLISLDSDNISHLSLSSPSPDADRDFEDAVDAAEKYDAEGNSRPAYEWGDTTDNDSGPDSSQVRGTKGGPGTGGPAIIQLDDPARYMERVYAVGGRPFPANRVPSDVPHPGMRVQLRRSNPQPTIWENITKLHVTDAGFCVAQLASRYLRMLRNYHGKTGLPGFMHAPRQGNDCHDALKTVYSYADFDPIHPDAPTDTPPWERPIIDFVQFFTLEDADYPLAARAHHRPSSTATADIVNVTAYATYILLRQYTLDIVNALRTEAAKRQPFYHRPMQTLESVFSSLMVREFVDFASYTHSGWNPAMTEPERQFLQAIYNLLELRGYHDYAMVIDHWLHLSFGDDAIIARLLYLGLLEPINSPTLSDPPGYDRFMFGAACRIVSIRHQYELSELLEDASGETAEMHRMFSQLGRSGPNNKPVNFLSPHCTTSEL